MTKLKKRNILFLWKHTTTFEKHDLEILKARYNVTGIRFEVTKTISIIRSLYLCDILYYWFPGDYKLFFTIIARLMGKKVVIVGGGQMATADNTAAMKYASVKYRFGYVSSARLCLKLAIRVIAVSKYEYNGLSRFVKKVNLYMIYNLISVDIPKSIATSRNRSSYKVVTISTIDKQYFIRKGLDTLIEAATILPKCNFIIVGKDKEDGTSELINKISPPNLTYLGYLDDKSLFEVLSEADIYCQLSRQEGFGVALGEAMAMGCVPVVSKMGSIPEVAGPDAFYIDERRNPEDVADIIKKALSIEREKIQVFQNRIKTLFHPAIREKKLINLIDEL